MTNTEIRTALYTELNSNWTSTPISWDNHSIPVTLPASFIAPHILMADSEEGEIGEDGVGIRHGEFIIQVFVKEGTGDLAMTGYIDTLEALYRKKDLSGVITEEPTSVKVPSANGYYQKNVKIPFFCFVN